MTLKKLGELPDSDKFVDQIEILKNELINYCTNKQTNIDNIQYRKIRRVLLSYPLKKEIIPDFLLTCRTLQEFWIFIKKLPHYEQRREYLNEQFNQVLDHFEFQVSRDLYDFNNNYEELELIGQGGFGQVYKYKNKLLDLHFAIKIFAPAFYNGDDESLERFFREASILFKLNHKNIIKILDVGLLSTRPFIKMEYFDGIDLNKALQKKGKFDSKKSLNLILSITEALNYAHEEVNIIHRDLKPSNILVAYPNKFKIIDFGLGAFIENELFSRVTKTGESIVSGYYTAPELISNPKLLDKKVDIYSLGAIWFTLLVGLPPAGSNLKEQLVSLGTLNQKYINSILRCLTSNNKRYSSCELLLEDLKNLYQDIEKNDSN